MMRGAWALMLVSVAAIAQAVLLLLGHLPGRWVMLAWVVIAAAGYAIAFACAAAAAQAKAQVQMLARAQMLALHRRRRAARQESQ